MRNALTKQAHGSLPYSNTRKTSKPTCATHVNPRTHKHAQINQRVHFKAYPRWASLARPPLTSQRCGRCLQSFHFQESAIHIHDLTIKGIAEHLSPVHYPIQQSRGNRAHVFNSSWHDVIGFLEQLQKYAQTHVKRRAINARPRIHGHAQIHQLD